MQLLSVQFIFHFVCLEGSSVKQDVTDKTQSVNKDVTDNAIGTVFTLKSKGKIYGYISNFFLIVE